MKRFIFILIFLFATEIYSDNADNLNYETESKNNSNKHSFELFLRLNRASWLPESIRRTSDANSSLGNSANNGIFTSYDPPSRDKKFENPDFKSFGFVYKNFVHKFSFDYNHLSLSQHFKVNFKYAGVYGSTGEEYSYIGSGFLYNIHPFRTENKFALTKEIFNKDRFLLSIGGGVRFLSITSKRNYPDFIPEYLQLASFVSSYSDITKTYGPQVSLRSELQLLRGLSLRTNLDVFFLQGISKSNFVSLNTYDFFTSNASNRIQFRGFDLTTELSFYLFRNLRLFFGYELILSRAKYLQYKELNNSLYFRSIISSDLNKYEYTQEKLDSLSLFYVGAGFIF
ncbi:LA_2444/LA_4059 family outer membrane protein [Leptospira weilii]|uniref:LA_2444/LA_4059 family outer membrane protein n=1 Tax=Leptospira weilii TaxID=28184 RepID=UPI00036149B5|nr:LA_2444/LA_4059 family outer membrane protein [Leptospira weilii]